MKRLFKLLKLCDSYAKFESVVLNNLNWYKPPAQWTKKELEAFYRQNGGK